MIHLSRKILEQRVRLFGPAVLYTVITGQAVAEPAPRPRQLSQTVGVVQNDLKFAGYDLGNIALRERVELTLTVNDVDPGADFVPDSGNISTAGGAVAWSIRQNDEHVFQTRSAVFERNRAVYVVHSNGLWRVAGEGGRPPTWETDVVQVRILEGDENFPKNRKLLATATHPIVAQLRFVDKKPDGTTAWAFPNGTFNPADQLTTSFTAPPDLTPRDQKDKQSIRVTFTPAGASPSVDSLPLNITAPQKITADRNGVIATTTTGFIRSDQRKAVVLIAKDFEGVEPEKVSYTLFDQFRDRIFESDRGNRFVQIREDVPWTGLESAVNWAIANVKTTSDNWRNLDSSEFTDMIRLVIPPNILKPADNAPKFGLAPGTEVLVQRYHVWRVSVSGNLDTKFTQNELVVSVVESKDRENYDEIRLKAVYQVSIPPEKQR